MNNDVEKHLNPSESIIMQRERLKIFGQLRVNLDPFPEEDDDEDEDEEEEEEPESVRHQTWTMFGGHKHEQVENPAAGDEDSDELFENGFNPVLSSFNPTKLKPLKPLEPLDISTKFTYSVDHSKSPRSQLNDLGSQLEREQHLRRRLEFELDELKKKIDNQYKPKLDSLASENSKLVKLLAESQRELKEWQNKSGLQSSHIDELDKLKKDNYQLAEIKAKLQEKEREIKTYQDLVKTVKINNKWYQLLSQIGKGGFSEVFHCISFKEAKSYALKTVNLNDLDGENIKLILNEIELLKKLKSTEKCIQIFDHELDKSKNLLHVVMELGSTDLSKYFKSEIQRYKCVREPERACYWKKMLEAVQAIHRAGIIHNDIKPSNFVVVGCEVKLIDFNISNSMNDRTSITLNFDCGTLSYMAPESIKNDGKRINQKVDVWSLGVILYLMTYGRLPFSHLKRQHQLMFAVCDPTRTELKLEPIADPHLYETIDRCLQYDPADRFSIDQLLAHSYLNSEF